MNYRLFEIKRNLYKAKIEERFFARLNEPALKDNDWSNEMIIFHIFIP